ncbi:hypothetical protein EVAR_66690_1 [Eumeta japonica]|uniref:Uncharacterized protein n=1 Tax=Eumeta variegata TaxID=151549 RepID=A0A4C1ZN75_EUMVA|nr:hypothetical protein EVAR_66690_1 [Eumeta japonica]
MALAKLIRHRCGVLPQTGMNTDRVGFITDLIQNAKGADKGSRALQSAVKRQKGTDGWLLLNFRSTSPFFCVAGHFKNSIRNYKCRENSKGRYLGHAGGVAGTTDDGWFKIN